jgi:hypothetical protein
LADTCWKPSDDPSQIWEDLPPTPPTAVFDDSSIACIAVACFMVAGMPYPELEWTDDGKTPIYVCGEWPTVTPPEGGGGVPPTLRGFSNAFSSGFN